ncbi:MAG: hypothetical protein JRH15_12760 [Deltaproteobacteria bacterium]|nr:hypothetical protein [Deltaproteobacteria bacterium]
MSKLKTIVCVVLIFSVGFLSGVIGSHLYVRNRIEKSIAAGNPHAMRFMGHLFRKLDLSQSQRKAIEDILASSREKWVDLRVRYRPEFEAAFEDTLDQVKAVLRPEQKAKLEKMIAKMKGRIQRLGGRGPFGRDGRGLGR